MRVRVRVYARTRARARTRVCARACVGCATRRALRATRRTARATRRAEQPTQLAYPVSLRPRARMCVYARAHARAESSPLIAGSGRICHGLTLPSSCVGAHDEGTMRGTAPWHPHQPRPSAPLPPPHSAPIPNGFDDPLFPHYEATAQCIFAFPFLHWSIFCIGPIMRGSLRGCAPRRMMMREEGNVNRRSPTPTPHHSPSPHR